MDPKESLDAYSRMQQSEAALHWQRNSYFLVVSSILLVAVGQLQANPVLVQFHVKIIQFFIGLSGLVLNVGWFFIQDRSRRYIDYWKKKARELKVSDEKIPELYPAKLGGVEMRLVALTLPVPFILLWIVIMILAFS